MSQATKQSAEWTKPDLVRLGTIKDVAGPSGTLAQSPVQNRS